MSYWTKKRKVHRHVERHLQNMVEMTRTSMEDTPTSNNASCCSSSSTRPMVEMTRTSMEETPASKTNNASSRTSSSTSTGPISKPMCGRNDINNPHIPLVGSVQINDAGLLGKPNDVFSENDNYACSGQSTIAGNRPTFSDCEDLNENQSHSDDDNEADDDVINCDTLQQKLSDWAIRNNITHTALGHLLDVLKSYHPDLPKDPRTLLSTGNIEGIKLISGGSYYHFGLASQIKSVISGDMKLKGKQSILLQLSTDGLPLFKSSSDQFWPLLGLLPESSRPAPFIIGLYHGKTKPSNQEEFLGDFVSEMVSLQNHGFEHEGRVYDVQITSFICDAPARAYIKRTKCHNGYSACDKCTQRGLYKGKMTYPETNADLRTDASFRNREDDDHHTGENPLHSLNIDMVSAFPLDYMHLVCLGVTRRLILLWLKGPLSCRLGSLAKKMISDFLINSRKFIPTEFARKPRSLSEIERWKATEFRLFLLYVGPVALKGKLEDHMYKNFLLLSVGIYILVSPRLCAPLCEFANCLLVNFVKHFAALYGADQLVYNVHNLVHIAQDAKIHGPLDAFSAFPFENFLKHIKRLVRKPTLPLQQVVLRINEKANLTETTNDTPSVRPLLTKPHTNGPIPVDATYACAEQYGAVQLDSFLLSSAPGDNCMSLGSEICLVKNILKVEDGIFVVYQAFSLREPFFEYPVKSNRIGIYRVCRLSKDLGVAKITRIESKCVLLPEKDTHIVIPLIHTHKF